VHGLRENSTEKITVNVPDKLILSNVSRVIPISKTKEDGLAKQSSNNENQNKNIRAGLKFLHKK